MVVTCKDVWREISNYIDDDIEPGLRAAMEEHFRGCQRCSAVLNGTRNVIRLYSDERMLEVPLGFSRRLERRLEQSRQQSRRSFLGWMAAAAAAALVFGAIEVSRSSLSNRSSLRSQLAQQAVGIPPEMMVIVATDGKNFHVTGCPFIHDKTNLRTISAREAMKEVYTPCVRCMKKYIKT